MLESVESAAAAAAAGRTRRRVAVVVQRWGAGLAGGAEQHARTIVTALRPTHEMTVLTSCAADATTWAMSYPPGESLEDGVRVQRFAHGLRNAGGRARVPLRHKLRLIGAPLLDALGVQRVARVQGDDRTDGHEFLRRQGPTSPDLLAHLQQAASRYDAVLFMTALYHPTAEGLPACNAPTVLVPTLHDEKPMYLPWFRRVFAAASETLYNTAAERRLAQRLYGADAHVGRLVGVGVDAVLPADAAELRARHALPERYVVYVGRIEKGKGCVDLLQAWDAVQGQVPGAALVFVGKGDLALPARADVRALGFIPRAERDAVVAGAHALVMPSRYESLSAVTLEAMALGVPVLVNGRCDPLADLAAASGGGAAYGGAAGLRRGLVQALQRPAEERRRLGESGRRHVAAHYAWPRVVGEWLDAVERVAAAA